MPSAKGPLTGALAIGLAVRVFSAAAATSLSSSMAADAALDVSSTRIRMRLSLFFVVVYFSALCNKIGAALITIRDKGIHWIPTKTTVSQ